MIEWCNVNEGFISAILSIVSILLSVLAVVISIIISKFPYKKKIAISFYTYLGAGSNTGNDYYSVEATNIGNRVIKVSFVGIGYKESGNWKKLYSIHMKNAQNEMLNINTTVNSVYEINGVNECLKNHKLYAIAIDIEGKIYKRKIK